MKIKDYSEYVKSKVASSMKVGFCAAVMLTAVFNIQFWQFVTIGSALGLGIAYAWYRLDVLIFGIVQKLDSVAVKADVTENEKRLVKFFARGKRMQDVEI